MERLELLKVDLLDSLRPLVEEFEGLSRELEKGLGWHYLLDLPWAAHQLRHAAPGSVVLDAGAGLGLMQWFLARRGVNVISVDRSRRADLPPPVRRRFTVGGLVPSDAPAPAFRPRDLLPPRRLRHWGSWPRRVGGAVRALGGRRSRAPGLVRLYTADLHDLSALPDASVDHVVSISALEHNEPDSLAAIVRELLRVLKPNGRLVATVGAAKDEDWFHAPSQGWCFTEPTLRKLFGLGPSTVSNFAEYDRCFEQLRACRELAEKLGDYYRTPGNHGMPSGRWDPEYAVAGVVRVRSSRGPTS